MGAFKKILTFIFSAIFLLSSSGILIYESYCSCSQQSNVSLYVTPETCEVDFHANHKNNHETFEHDQNKHNCSDCVSHTSSCGCDSFNVKLFKLKDQLIDEEVKIVKTQIFQLQVFHKDIDLYLDSKKDIALNDNTYIEPPPQKKSTTEFLVSIHQLKIPDIA